MAHYIYRTSMFWHGGCLQEPYGLDKCLNVWTSKAVAHSNWRQKRRGNDPRMPFSLIYFFAPISIFYIPHNHVIPQAMPHAFPQTHSAFYPHLYSEAMLCGCKFQFRHDWANVLLPMGFFFPASGINPAKSVRRYNSNMHLHYSAVNSWLTIPTFPQSEIMSAKSKLSALGIWEWGCPKRGDAHITVSAAGEMYKR